MLGVVLHAPRDPFYSPKAARSRWRSIWKAILAFCRVAYRTVRWCTGQCPVRQAASAEEAALGFFLRRLRLKFTGLSGVHRTVRCARSATVGNGRFRHLRKQIGHRTVSGVHRTVRCATRQKAKMAFQICSQRLLAALGL